MVGPRRSRPRVLKVHKTRHHYRVRFLQPKKDAKTRTLTLSKEKGYKAVRQKPKGKPYQTQAILIERRQGRTQKSAVKKAKELVS